MVFLRIILFNAFLMSYMYINKWYTMQMWKKSNKTTKLNMTPFSLVIYSLFPFMLYPLMWYNEFIYYIWYEILTLYKYIIKVSNIQKCNKSAKLSIEHWNPHFCTTNYISISQNIIWFDSKSIYYVLIMLYHDIWVQRSLYNRLHMIY